MSSTLDQSKDSFSTRINPFAAAPSVKSKDQERDGASREVTPVPATATPNSQRSGTASPAPGPERTLPISTKDTTSTQNKIPIDKNVFYNEETLKYMRIIDMYKKLGIGKDIELPRLVIAGTQSCGKSSLLENLTGLPVPITAGIGTRFPIEITLIEDPTKFQIKPSIVLDPKASRLSSKDMENMQKFNLGKVYHAPMSQEQFEDVLRETSSLFGVPPPVFARDQVSPITSLENYSTQISSHTLQIEMRGPDFKSLSFVDTPGLYEARTRHQDSTSVVDIEKLVVSLIEEKRTVIVAVMDATQGTEAQKIFKFADDVDITGERTLGVLTKCDHVKTKDTDAFQATIKRATNQERVLHHGWYVVKNRSSTETKQNVSLEAARLIEGALFAEQEWSPHSSGIQEDRMGISALRTGLSNVFCAHIRAEFPAFNQQTRNILAQRRTQLQNLGPARSTLTEQRKYLYSMVTAYQKPKLQCLIDDLKPEPVKPIFAGVNSSAPLAPVILDRKLAYQKKKILRDALTAQGAAWTFRPPTGKKDEASDKAAGNRAIFEIKHENIYTWINERYQSTKSCAIPGLVPYPLVERLFEEQTAKWGPTTDVFVDGVKELFMAAVEYCLSQACHNKTVLVSLKEIVFDALKDRIKQFREFCHRLIRNEQTGLQVVAGEEQFLREIKEARTLRFISAIARLESEPFFSKNTSESSSTLFSTGIGSNLFGQTPPVTTTTSVNLPQSKSSRGLFSFDTTVPPLNSQVFPPEAKATSSAAQQIGNVSGTETASVPQVNFGTLLQFMQINRNKIMEVLTDDRQIVFEIHDILSAYYKTSVQHYTDSVCKDGLKQSFVEEMMDVFSIDFVDSLSDEEVTRISAESAADRKARRELKEDIEKLETAIATSEAILKESLGV